MQRVSEMQSQSLTNAKEMENSKRQQCFDLYIYDMNETVKYQVIKEHANE